MEEENEVEVCSNCGASGEHDSCVMCNECGDYQSRCDNCDGCVDCHSCYYCDRGHYTASTCTNCNNCGRHCGCARCNDNCRRVLTDSSVCRECDEDGVERCNECCEEHDPNGIPFHESDLPKLLSLPRVGFKRNPLKRTIGVEIEVNGAKKYDAVRAMVKAEDVAVVYDGSLSRRGYEINTRPANGDSFLAHIAAICAAIKKDSGFADDHCGLHVHVDASDMKWLDLRRLIYLYAWLEEGLFALLNQSRRNGQYSQVCAQRFVRWIEEPSSAKGLTFPNKFKAKLVSKMYGVPERRALGKAQQFELKRLQRDKYHSTRYNALNVHSWFLRGTLEFRHAQGMTDANDISMWAMLCAAIVDVAVRKSDAELKAVRPGIYGLLEIAPTKTVRDWIQSTFRAKYKDSIDACFKENPKASPFNHSITSGGSRLSEDELEYLNNPPRPGCDCIDCKRLYEGVSWKIQELKKKLETNKKSVPDNLYDVMREGARYYSDTAAV